MKNACKKMLIINRIYNFPATFMGIVSTMPIVTIKIGFSYLSLFSVSFILFVVFALYIVAAKKNYHFAFGRTKKLLFFFLSWPILSYLVGLIYMPSDWQPSMTSYALKSMAYILVFLMICLIDDRKFCGSYAKGLVIGFSINAIWSIAELFVFIILHKSLNNMVFAESLATLDRSSIIYNIYGGVRVSGLNYDPAHLGGIIPALLFFGLFVKKWILVVLAIMSLIAAQSTTCLLGCAVVLAFYFAYQFMYKRKQKKRKFNFTKKTIIITMILMLVAVILIVIIFSNPQSRKTIIDAFQNNLNGFIGRIKNVYIRNNVADFRANPRKVYYGKMLESLFSRDPISALVGTGLGTSMYAYRAYVPGGVAGGNGEPDTTYIDYLFDLGIVGLSIYIAFLVISCLCLAKKLRHQQKNSTVVYLGLIINMIVASFTYHYVFTAYQILAFMFLTLQTDKSDETHHLEEQAY